MDQAGVVLEHLLEVRDAPVLRRRVAEETAFDVVVGAASVHLLERVDRHPPELLVPAHRGLLEEEQQGVGLRELRRDAEPAVLGVIGVPDSVDDLVDQPGLQLAGAARDTEGGALAGLQHACRDLRLVVAVVAGDADERARHLVGRKVRRASEDVSRRREERRRRPPAHVVALVNVGADVVVDPHGDVIAIDDVDHARVRISRLVHDVTPVAPHRGDGQQHGLACEPRLLERFLRPRVPSDLRRAVRPGREVELLGGLGAHGSKVTMRR